MVIRVQTRDNEPVDKALRRLRKLCNNEGLTRTTKSKAYFEKPSERRRREARERIKAIRIACRAKETDTAKLMQRRRKARKSAAAARPEEGMPDDGGEAPRSHGPRRFGPGAGPPPAARASGAPAGIGARRPNAAEAPVAS